MSHEDRDAFQWSPLPGPQRSILALQLLTALRTNSPGATAIVFGLPVLLWVFFFACNDVTGCPVPSLLSPRTLTWDKLKSEIPWPADGLRGFVSWEATAWLLAYYFLSLLLHVALPAQEVLGTKLKESGRPLKYRFNGKSPRLVRSLHDPRRTRVRTDQLTSPPQLSPPPSSS